MQELVPHIVGRSADNSLVAPPNGKTLFALLSLKHNGQAPFAGDLGIQLVRLR